MSDRVSEFGESIRGSIHLARVLGLCGYGFNDGARRALLALLPGPLSDGVAAAWRQGDELLLTAEGEMEESLASPWIALRAAQEQTSGDAGSTDADVADGEAAVEEFAEDSDTGDADVDAFFAEAEVAIGATTSEPEPESELPATLLARLMVGADAAAAARLLSDLPLALQGEVVVRIARSTALSVRQVLSEQERPALVALRQVLGEGAERWGVEKACDILRALDGTPPLRRALGSAAQVDTQVVAVVQSHLFDFDDLIRLRDTELQALLGACDNANLARALLGAHDAVRDRILANVSDRRSALVGDETELHAEATEDEVDLARREILARARLLYENGTIVTYFGSIQSEAPLHDPDPIEPEDEAEPQPRQEAKQKAPSSPPPANQRRIFAIGLAAGVALLALVSLVSLLSSRQSTSSRRTTPAGTGTLAGSSSGRIAVAIESDPSEGNEPSARQDTGGASQLTPGEILRTPAGVQALLEFPSTRGSTMVDVDAGSTVIGADRPDDANQTNQERASEKSDIASFYLRVGRVKVSVSGEQFIVRTPVAQIHATAGSVFRVRVVLNGGMKVHSVNGPVQVIAGDRQWDLATGQGLAMGVNRSVEYYQTVEGQGESDLSH